MKNSLVILFLVMVQSPIIPLEYLTAKSANGQFDDDANPNFDKPIPTEKPKIDVNIEGTDNDDKIKGGEGDDKIEGMLGNDKLSGGRGNDKLDGAEGDDILFGGRNDDELDGAEGNDEMIGGRGSDSFTCDQFDVILDFNSGEGDQVSGTCSPADHFKPEPVIENISFLI